MGVGQLEHPQLVARRRSAVEPGHHADLGAELGQALLVAGLDALDEVDDERGVAQACRRTAAPTAPGCGLPGTTGRRSRRRTPSIRPRDAGRMPLGLRTAAGRCCGCGRQRSPAVRRPAAPGEPAWQDGQWLRRAAGQVMDGAAAALGGPAPVRPGRASCALYHRVGGRSGIEVDLPGRSSTSRWRGSANRRAVTLDDAARWPLASPRRRPEPSPVVVDLRRRHRRPGRRRPADPGAPPACRPSSTWRPTSSTAGVPFPNDGGPLSWAAVARGGRRPVW